MLIAIVGDLGSGKTLYMTRKALKIKRPIYSNFKIKVPNYIELSILDLLSLPTNIVLFLDDAYTWLESRTSGKKLNRFLSYIILASRKVNIDVYASCQLFGSIDLRFRDQANKMVICKRTKYGFIYQIRKKVLTHQFKVKIISKTYFFSNRNAKYYYPYYNTLEIVEPSDKADLELDILKRYPKQLKVRVKAIGKAIAEQIDPITHDSVKSALFTNGYPIGYEPFVYLYLKGALII